MGGRHPPSAIARQVPWLSLLLAVALVMDCLGSLVQAIDEGGRRLPSEGSALAAPLAQAGCTPRPAVTVNVSADRDARRMNVTITAGRGALKEIRFGAASNGLLELPGFAVPSSGNVTITPPAGARTLTFAAWQEQMGAAFRVPIVAVDDCGPWETFIGGGAEWWATPIPTPTPVPQCTPRPPVTVNVSPDRDAKLLNVTITAGRGALREVRFGSATNGTLSLPGIVGASAGDVTVTPAGGARELTFVASQAQTGQPFHVPIVAVDDCGEWQTFVGGGAQWWATQVPTHTATPTATPTQTPTPTATVTPTATTPPDPTPPLPPDPKSVAPPLDLSVVTTIGDATRFLYTGSNPIQTGLTAAIEPFRAAVLRGTVLQKDGSPLSGTVVKVLGHPEYGQTVSRADGEYDLAVNGGGPLTLTFDRVNHLPAQRQVDVPWQQFTSVDDVILIQADSRVTTVTLGTGAPEPVQVARGSPQTDADGTRQLTLLFPSTTQATLELPDGSTQPITTLNVRATEYTVGPNGPKTMPAVLPPNSGYTYAFELNADEAVAAGARHVRFNQPIPVYTENFLNFPVGEPVPLGAYDREQGVWVPHDNGLVIRILSVVGGLAVLDLTGSGQPASAQALTDLGVTDAERQRLATLYQPGQSLWRMPVPHFTWPWDGNWGFGCEPDNNGRANCYAPEQQDPVGDGPPPKSCKVRGSIIECETQTLGEAIDVAGTPFQLHYRSDRVPGRTAGRTLQIPITQPLLSGLPFPTWAKDIVLQIDVAGQKHERRFTAAPGQTYTFTWDGKDGYGRVVQGTALTTIRLGYVYRTVALSAGGTQRGFGSSSPSNVALSVGRIGSEIIRWKTVYSTELANLDARPRGLGTWTLSHHHVYDPVGRTLHMGDGRRRSAGHDGLIIERILSATGPISVAPLPDGTVLVIRGDVVQRLHLDGTLQTIPRSPNVTGTLFDLAVGPDNSIYVLALPVGRGQVWRLTLNGQWSLVAGTASGNNAADGVPATQAWLNTPQHMAVGQDGSLYINQQCKVRRVGPDGLIHTVAGGDTCGFSGDGGPATSARLSAGGGGLAVGPDGSLYIADNFNHRVRRVGVDGIITTVVGTGTPGWGGEGGPPRLAERRHPLRLAFGRDGSLHILMVAESPTSEWLLVRRVGGDETIRTILGRTVPFPHVDGGPATHAFITGVNGDIEIGPDDAVYVAQFSAVLFRAAKKLPGLGPSRPVVTSEDGAELYVFDADGRHLQTIHTMTNAVLYTFRYDGAGRLSTVTDGDGNVTTIQRGTGGAPTAIVGPYGQVTTLTVDGNGFLASIANPNGDTTSLTYGTGGLLASLRDARQQAWTFEYDAEGRLKKDTDPAGDVQMLSRGEVHSDDAIRKLLGIQVSLSNDLSRVRRYFYERVVNGAARQVLTDPSGLQTEIVTGSDGTTVTTGPDGMKTTTALGPDPRWGMDSPTVSTTVRTPGGKTLVSTVQRTATLADPDDLQSLTGQTETVTVNGRSYTRTYNASTRTFNDQTPAGRTRTTTIDAQGRVASEQVAGLAPITYAYDLRGRLTTITHGSGAGARTTILAYNAQGFLETITDPLSRTVGFTYDPAGRVLTQTLPGNRTVTFAYDGNGNTTGVTPPGRPAHTFGYTGVNLPSTYSPPSAGAGNWTTTNTYATDRQLTKVALPTGQSVDLAYDAAGRLTGVTLPRGAITRTYEGQTGRLASLTAPGGLGLAFGYDGGLLTSETASGSVPGSLGWTYDNDFRVTTQTVSGGSSVNLGYDADSLLTSVGGLSLTRSSQHGLVLGSTLGSVTDAWGYSTFGEPDTYAASVGGSEALRFQYARDALGRITSKTETAGGTTDTFGYTYDPAGRLSEVRKNGILTASYTYDANGNRLTAPNLTGTPTYDDQDRLLQYGSNAYAYTADGRLATKTAPGGTTTYGYDELGNLLAASLPNGTQLEYLVDGRNRRVGKKVNGALVQGFLYNGQLRVAAELDGSGAVVSRFVYGTRLNVPEYMVRGGTSYRIVADHLGSPRLVVDVATGAVVQRLEYDEWGNVLADTSPGFQPFGFAGGLYDRDTKLVRFGARDYDPEVSRWTAKDPLVFGGGDTSLYAYSENNPVSMLDPSGLTSIFDRAIDQYDTWAKQQADAGRFWTGAVPLQVFSTFLEFARLWVPILGRSDAILDTDIICNPAGYLKGLFTEFFPVEWLTKKSRGLEWYRAVAPQLDAVQRNLRVIEFVERTKNYGDLWDLANLLEPLDEALNGKR